jgi:hypothetical protein
LAGSLREVKRMKPGRNLMKRSQLSSVSPELARRGITDYTYKDLRGQGVGIEAIAHSNGGRAVTQYTMNYHGNGYETNFLTKRWN